MNRMTKLGIVAALLLATGGAAQNAGATPREETQLNNARMEIDKHAGIKSNEEHAKILGEHFKVPVATILTLSAQNQGWGAVNVELALAWEINRLHPQTSPLITGSLAEVERMRVGGSSWGKIAKTMEIELAPVIKEARDTAKTLRTADHAAAQRKANALKVEESQQIIKEDHKMLKADKEQKSR